MSLILLASILLRLVAMVVSAWTWRRSRDRRVLFLTVMLALMAARQLLTLFAQRDSWGTIGTGSMVEMPGLAVSVMALAAVIFLEQTLTAFREKSEELRASEARYRSLFDGNLAGVYRSTVGGRLLDCNTSFARMLGYDSPRDLIAGASSSPYSDSEVRERFLSDLRRRGSLVSYESSLRRQDGTTLRTVENVTLLPDEEGRPQIIEGTIIDVSRERLIEEHREPARGLRPPIALLHSLETVARSQTLFLDSLSEENLSHSTRTVLTSLIVRANHSVRQLVWPGWMDDQGNTPNLNQLVEDLETTLRALVGTEMEIGFALEPGRLPVAAPPDELRYLVLALAVSGAEAVSGRGKLMVRTSAREGDQACLTIETEGSGAVEPVRLESFEAHFGPESEVDDHGMGLVVARELVGSRQGSLEVEVRRQCIVARACLPLSVLATESQEPALLGDTKKLRILLVEDEDVTRRSLADLLTALGFDVVTAGFGSQALALPREPAFDILVTDLLLPETTGPVLAQNLLERWPGMGVILMSGYAGDEDARRAVDEGKLRFLEKPFEARDLVREIETVLGRSKEMSDPDV